MHALMFRLSDPRQVSLYWYVFSLQGMAASMGSSNFPWVFLQHIQGHMCFCDHVNVSQWYWE